jgi:hypothetical protein
MQKKNLIKKKYIYILIKNYIYFIIYKKFIEKTFKKK